MNAVGLEGWGKRAGYIVAIATVIGTAAGIMWQAPKFIWPAPKAVPPAVELAAPVPKQSGNLFCMMERTADDALVALSRYYNEKAATIRPPIWHTCAPGWEATFAGSEPAQGGGWLALLMTGGPAIYARVQTNPLGVLKPYQRVRVLGTIDKYEPAQLHWAGRIYLTDAEIRPK